MEHEAFERLARIGTYDSRLPEVEGAERIIPILEGMSPLAVVGYLQYCNRIERALESEQYKGVKLTPEEESTLQETASIGSHISRALELLPSRNVGHARAIMLAMSRSPLTDDRMWATYLISSFTRYDHESGVQLWSRLLSDSENNVRSSAHESLPDASLLDDPEVLMQELEACGLTRDDFSRLHWIYIDHLDSGRSSE